MDYAHYDDPSVRLAIDLINAYGTVPRAADGRSNKALPELVPFLEERGIESAGLDGAEEEARRIADRLHEVFTTDDHAAAVAIVNEMLAASRALPQISGHDDMDWHLHYYAADADPIDRLTVTSAMGVATVICTGGLRRLGRCAGTECADVFVDTSRNNRRRFCSDGCANRTHVAAHRARRRGAHTT